MKILVIDDCPAMINILKGLLIEIGYTDILVASNGRQALKMMDQKKFDIVFTDWNMPEMSGIELVEIIRSSKKSKDQIIIMVTVETTKENVELADKYVVDGYIAKPLSADTLKAKINKALARQNESRDELINLCYKRLKQRLQDKIEAEGGVKSPDPWS